MTQLAFVSTSRNSDYPETNSKFTPENPWNWKMILSFLGSVSLWACQLTAKQQHTKSAATKVKSQPFSPGRRRNHRWIMKTHPWTIVQRVNMHVYIKFWNHHDANLLHGMQFTPVKGGKSETSQNPSVWLKAIKVV